MVQTRIEKDYFEWMYELVCKDRYSKDISYRKLLKRLHQIEFIYFIPKDSNRAEDGIDLRYRYGYFNNIDNVEERITGPCSVLEMILALAIRCEGYMDDAVIGDRTGQWFWRMIVNLGLGAMDDNHYDEHKIDEAIDILLHREYSSDGRGGLFFVRDCQYDLRNMEIWTQLLCYLNSIA